MMESRKKLIYLALGVVLLVGVAAIGYVSISRPRAEITESHHDFGTVNEDQRLSYTFLIKNSGGGLLKIEGVKADCTCTATAYDRLIPPGRKGTLTLTIKPFALRGLFAKKTRVFLNDPDHPQVVFTLRGLSRPLIEVQPGYIIRFQGKSGEDLNQQVRLTSHLPEPWDVSSFKTNIPQFIQVNLVAAEPGKSYVLEVRQTRQEPGKYRGMIELFTNVPKRPHLVLRVFGEVLPK
jgi:hypothetical protein